MTVIGSDVIPRLPDVVLYGKPGCHLCETAYETLVRVQQTEPFELTVVNILTDPDIFAEYAEAIPVVVVAGKQFCRYRVDEARFIECLQEVNNHYASPS
ncbi:MAG TPA: glutaredoxin family protein [Capsulimonadaceae bacterium]|jgi:glutaredoxin